MKSSSTHHCCGCKRAGLQNGKTQPKPSFRNSKYEVVTSHFGERSQLLSFLTISVFRSLDNHPSACLQAGPPPPVVEKPAAVALTTNQTLRPYIISA
eukprot:scaffold12800_cov202-Skeletonema_marinoi.AAC.4